MTEWKPLSTMRRDAGEVLLYGFDDGGDPRYAVFDAGYPDPSGDTFWVGPSEITPTHWMPLPPAPPVDEKAQQG